MLAKIVGNITTEGSLLTNVTSVSTNVHIVTDLSAVKA